TTGTRGRRLHYLGLGLLDLGRGLGGLGARDGLLDHHDLRAHPRVSRVGPLARPAAAALTAAPALASRVDPADHERRCARSDGARTSAARL
ncbi:hypothetical protein, partial [Streptomyces sp. BE133]|uniref:hypothetical protein n=1 Tax=Streptomyces sp. BE133 TaxID=3002523 RepID=UPI002E79D528